MSTLNSLKRIAAFPVQLVRYNRSRYWQKLPTRSYVKFLLAIFLMFSIIGFLNDITSGGRFVMIRLILETKNRDMPVDQLFGTIMQEVSDYGLQRDDQTMLLIRCL